MLCGYLGLLHFVATVKADEVNSNEGEVGSNFDLLGYALIQGFIRSNISLRSFLLPITKKYLCLG